MPVSKEAVKPENVNQFLSENPTSAIVRDTLRVALEENSNYIMYTPPAFTGSTQARNVLDTTMLELACATAPP